MKNIPGRLLYGCDTNSHYAIGMHVTDPYLWYQDSHGKTHVIMSALEVDRTRKNANVNHVHSMDKVDEYLLEHNYPTDTIHQALWLIKRDDASVIEVPEDFPFFIAKAFQERNITLKIADKYFFPQRTIKTAEEVELIRQAQALNEQAFERAFNILAEARIKCDGSIKWKNKTLTAEILRGQMNMVIAEAGGMPSDIIIACGAQGADPHEIGHGPLKANELIIIDSFPRGPNGNFYYGDLTRTVLKGKPSKKQLALYNAVKAGQQLGLNMLKAGINGADVHKAIDICFLEHGFETGVDDQGRQYGFFHGVGHSVGLEVHDDGPSVSKTRPAVMKAGYAVTVEPGLYYPELGGVRIEDIVHVMKNGIENLTTLPKELVIP